VTGNTTVGKPKGQRSHENDDENEKPGKNPDPLLMG
jgi:hypothetical protein